MCAGEPVHHCEKESDGTPVTSPRPVSSRRRGARSSRGARWRTLMIARMADPTLTETTLPAAEQRLPPGERVDRYRITGVLGWGGMGMVYAARDDELDRTIALKLVHTGASSSATSAQARVAREARAIAKLSHPNVIAVFDVGVHENDVFLAMELADRGTLRSVLESREHTWREVLDYYLDAGRGLAAAHAVGLVHRDFKPDNALVTRDGRAKVADFGIARALQDRTESTPQESGASIPPVESVADAKTIEVALTQAGAILGTPGYMAPEQMYGERADERADIFSFCVALYEGLYGERPFAGEKLGELRESVDKQRIKGPPPGRRVPEWVRAAVVRGLARKPSERWLTMEELLDALAKDPEKLLRRRRRTAIVTGGFVVAIIATALISTRGARPAVCAGANREMAEVWGPAQARAVSEAFDATGAPFAKEAFAGVSRKFDAYAADWVKMHTDACEATRVRKEQSDELLDLRVQCLRERREELRALADVFGRPDSKVVEQAQSAASGLTPLAQCADGASLRARRRVAVDPRQRAVLDDLSLDVAKANALSRAGKFEAAKRIADDVLNGARKGGDRVLAAEALVTRGAVLLAEGDYAGSERALVAASLDAVAGRDERTEAQAWTTLVRPRAELHHAYAAREAAEHAHACIDRIGDETFLAKLLVSEAMLRGNEGDLDGDLALTEESLKLRERLYGEEAPEVAVADASLAQIFTFMARYAEALPAATRAIALFEHAYGPMHPSVADALGIRSGVLQSLGRDDEALADVERALDIFERAFGKDTPRAAEPQAGIAEVLEDQGDYAGALVHLKARLALTERALGPDDSAVGDALENMVGVLVALGRLDEALTAAQRGLAIHSAMYAEDNELMEWPYAALGHALVARRSFVEAIAPLERALALRRAHPRDRLDTADVELLLGTALHESKRDKARGKSLVETALAAYVAGAPAHRLKRTEAEATLARWR